MDGVMFEQDRKGKSVLIVISDLSNELKTLIRKQLAAICHGEAKTARSATPYSYQRTLREFLKRYDSKSPNTKKGMIGELLTHILLLSHRNEMKPITPFFNLEERSIKKGFDIILFEQDEERIWITEIKSGEAPKDPAASKNKDLLHLAKSDLATRLSSHNETVWHNAINGATIALSKRSIKKKVTGILEKALTKTQKKIDSTTARNVILVAVLYKSLKDKITLKNVEEVCKEINSEALFKSVIAVSFQKETYQRVELFLKSELTSS